MIPENEMGVVVLFAQKIIGLPVEIVSIGTKFPDATIVVNGELRRVEFEYQGANFLAHKHSPLECDLIVCWENNLDDGFVLPVWTLSNDDWFFIPGLPTEEQRQIAYWKYRALRAENALKQTPPISVGRKLSTQQRRLSVDMARKENPDISNGELAKIFEVDPATIWRDIVALQELDKDISG